jgi:GT2 family glycosyltransferase
MFAIIIPCRKLEEAEYCAEVCRRYCSKVYVSVGNDAPGRLRDLAVNNTESKYLAFIDSDAYPAPNWLIKAEEYFNKYTNIEAVCGPGIIPPDSSFLELLSDLVLRCLPYNYRVIPKPQRYVAEYPTFNLIVKREAFKRVGGFDTDMITGEDTILCRKLNGILYTPDILVYHKRRPFGIKFFTQIGRYGINRGILIAYAFPLVPLAVVITLGVYTFFFIWGFLKRRL